MFGRFDTIPVVTDRHTQTPSQPLCHSKDAAYYVARVKTTVFVILVTHPKSYVQQRRRIAAISAANRQSGCEDGCYREKFRNVGAWGSQIQNNIFRVFTVLFDYLAHSLQETVLPQTNDTDGKPRFWRCAFC